MKKILFVNQSSGYLMTDIVNAFAEKYDEVVLMYGSLIENERQLDSKVKVDRICAYDRGSSAKRIVTWLKGTRQIYHKLKHLYRDYEVVYVTNPPMAYLSSLRLKNIFSVIVFDTYPDALSNIGIKEGNPIFRLWSKWNKKIFGKAKSVITLSEGMANCLANYVERNKIKVVPCWSANSHFAPIAKENNPFVKKHQLEDKFVVMYSGNMGHTHNVQVLVECAKRLKDDPVIHFMLIGGGKKKAELEQTVREHNLINCTFLDWLPVEQMPYSLASADLGVVSLNDATAQLSVPSKSYNLMAVGAPLLCIAPKSSEIARLVDNFDNGKCFQPEEIDSIVAFIKDLSNNPQTKKQMSDNSLKAAGNFTFENARLYV